MNQALGLRRITGAMAVRPPGASIANLVPPDIEEAKLLMRAVATAGSGLPGGPRAVLVASW